jgi:hypothetical protein
MAYVLMGVLRCIALPHTQIAAATCGTSALSCSRAAPSSGSVFGASNAPCGGCDGFDRHSCRRGDAFFRSVNVPA